MLKTTLLAAAAGLALFTTSLSAQAYDRHVKVINETGETIRHFYASNVGQDSWEEDILGDDVLVPADWVRINIDDGSGYCLYDFKAVFSDGDVLVKRRVNVCEISTFHYTD